MASNLVADRELMRAMTLLRKSSGTLKGYFPLEYPSIHLKFMLPHPRYGLPHPQKLFHESKAFIRLILGGNKSGKTHPVLAEFCMHLTGIYPDWFPKYNRREGKVRGRIIINDYGTVYREDILPYLEFFIPKKMYSGEGERKKNSIGVYNDWKLSNGNTFHVMTNEQEVEQFEGWEGELLVVNEPCSQSKFNASVRGLVVTGGKVMMALTPLKLSGWMLDDIIPRKDCDWWEMEIWDNPLLKKKQIDEFLRSIIDEAELEAREKGKFMKLSGRVYKRFDHKIHIITPFDIPKDWNNYFTIDPHDKNPHAMLWGAVDASNHIYFYDYLWAKDKTVKELCEIIKQKEAGGKIWNRFMDGKYVNKPMGDRGETWGGLYGEYGIQCNPCNIDFGVRKSIMEEYLLYDTQKPISAENRPKVYWFNTLTEPIRQMEQFSWDDWSDKVEEKHGSKTTTKRKFSHFPNAAEFLVAYRPRYRMEAKYSTRPLPIRMQKSYI